MLSNSRIGEIAKATLAGAIVFGAATMILLGPAQPHSAMPAANTPLGWEYPTRCCWGPAAGRTGDCGMIPSSAVTEGPNGYRLRLKPGDHPYITKESEFTVAYDRAEVAPDGAFHVCFRKRPDGELDVRCFFAGAQGY